VLDVSRPRRGPGGDKRPLVAAACSSIACHVHFHMLFHRPCSACRAAIAPGWAHGGPRSQYSQSEQALCWCWTHTRPIAGPPRCNNKTGSACIGTPVNLGTACPSTGLHNAAGLRIASICMSSRRMHFIGQLLISLKCALRHIGPVVFWPAPRSRGSSQIQLVDANHRSAGGCHWTRQNQSDASIHPMRDHISSNIQSDYFIACRWLVRQETRIILTKQQTCDTLQIPVIRGYDSFQLCKTAARFARLIDQDERMVWPAPPPLSRFLSSTFPPARHSISIIRLGLRKDQSELAFSKRTSGSTWTLFQRDMCANCTEGRRSNTSFKVEQANRLATALQIFPNLRLSPVSRPQRKFLRQDSACDAVIAAQGILTVRRP
jgi:hypothetical protein